MASKKHAVEDSAIPPESKEQRASLLDHEYQGLDASKQPQGMKVYAILQRRDDTIDLKENRCYFSKQDLPTDHSSTSTGDEVSFKEDLGSSYVRFAPRVSNRSGVIYDPVNRESFNTNKKAKQCALCGLVLLAVFVVISTVLGVIACVASLYVRLNHVGADLDGINLMGQVPSMPAVSCSDILQAMPNAPTGDYWIRSTNGTVVQVYCDMTRVCGGVGGGWKRIASIDMRDPSTRCPDGLCLNSTSPRTCRRCAAAANCTRTEFSVPVGYSKVCGKVIGYQVGSTDGFSTQEAPDADGIDLSRGLEQMHIWTFVAGRTENASHEQTCPCFHGRSTATNMSCYVYIVNDYFCDTAGELSDESRVFYFDDPLWDNRGCNTDNTCCSFNHPPWFYRDLDQIATDSMVMRICLNQDSTDEDIGLEQVELYVQ